MKAWEICNKENLGKIYKDNNGDKWKVVEVFTNKYDLENNNELTDCDKLTDANFMSDIIAMDFKEIVDWSKVPVDTKILVRNYKENKWKKRHFAKYEDGKIYAWYNGYTSFTVEETTQWNCAKLYEGE